MGRLLNQMLPQKYVDSMRWTDIFSDPRLYQTQVVEVLPREESEPKKAKGAL